MTVRYDYARLARIGMPEAVFCLDKTASQLRAIVTELTGQDKPVLFTRLSESQYEGIRQMAGDSLDYDAESATAVMHGYLPPRDGSVAVVTAGTSDIPVAAEACRTLEFLGVKATCIVDVGVAGIWRLLERVEEIITCAAALWDTALRAMLASCAQVITVTNIDNGFGAACAANRILLARNRT